MDDFELLAEYVRGSEQAFATLVHRHLDAVYSVAVRVLRSPQLAEEAAFATFHDLARNAPRLKPASPLIAWLFCVARRTAIDSLRREGRRQVREVEACSEPAADTRIHDLEMLEALDCALERLKPADRDILLQRFYEELPVTTIARSLEITAEAAQKRIERALDRLRARLPSPPQRSAETVAGGLTQFASQLPPIGMATAILGRMPAASKTSAAAKITWMTVGQKTAIGLALTALLATELWQFVRFDRLQGESAASRRAADGVEQELGRVREELRMARQLQDQARKEHLELLSLRGRVQQFRAELLQAQQASRSSSEQISPAPAQDSILFSLALTNQIPPGQSLIAGGWRTLGTRRYLLVTPERQKDATDNEFIVTKSQVIAAPETFWNEIGWGEARSDAHHSAVAGLLKQSEVDALLAAARNASGAEFSNVSRAERNEGEYLGFGFSVDDEAGSGVMLSLDVRPRLSPDGQSVTLEIQPSDLGTNAPVHPSLHSAP